MIVFIKPAHVRADALNDEKKTIDSNSNYNNQLGWVLKFTRILANEKKSCR